MSKILLVEDSVDILNMNASMLELNGYEVLRAENIVKAEECLKNDEPDLIVLDIMLPDGNGIAWCKKIKQYRSVPVLFLSALNESADVVAGLRAGGDDYLAKPYDMEVLLARIETRLNASKAENRYASFGELRLDIYTDTATFKGVDLCLSQKEFLMLHAIVLGSKNGKPISKEKLLETVWGLSTGKDANSIYTAISRLNSKLSGCKSQLTVSSLKANGYFLEQI